MLIVLTFTLILFSILFSISIEDYKTMFISENKLITFAIAGFFYLISLKLLNEEINIINLIVNHTISMILMFIIMFLISYLGYKIYRKTSLGIGDIKLSSISTIWLGIELSFISLCISFLLSAIYTLYRIITKRFIPYQQFPFAPFISIGILSTWIIDKI